MQGPIEMEYYEILQEALDEAAAMEASAARQPFSTDAEKKAPERALQQALRTNNAPQPRSRQQG